MAVITAVLVSIGGSPYADATAVEHMEKSTDHIKKIDRPYVLTKVFNTLSNDNNNMYVHMDTRMKYPYVKRLKFRIPVT